MRIEALVIHHSASLWGDVEALRQWHTARPPQGNGWTDVGYHRVIGNGFRTYQAWRQGAYSAVHDGHIQPGRADDRPGAHCPGWNTRSLGICLIGNYDLAPPTPRQWAALVDACARLCRRHRLPATAILGHREAAAANRPTACPGRRLDLDRLRAEVAARLTSSA